jgi:retron-type reverse transcriptase
VLPPLERRDPFTPPSSLILAHSPLPLGSLFLRCLASFGESLQVVTSPFRPGRSAHQALQALRTGFMSHGLRWVIDLDIENYFGSISHSHLRSFLDRRVTDGVIRRMIDKWLKAGVLEDGLLRHATEGSPQGGVVSPCLSNIFLHHVLDEWFENEVKPRLKGKSTLVRFADDGAPRRRSQRQSVSISFASALRTSID